MRLMYVRRGGVSVARSLLTCLYRVPFLCPDNLLCGLCPRAGQCPRDESDPNNIKFTTAMCGPGTGCPAAISAFDDATVSQMRAGFAVAGSPL